MQVLRGDRRGQRKARKQNRLIPRTHGDGPGLQPSGANDVSRDSSARPSCGLSGYHCSGEPAAGMALTLLAILTAIYKPSRQVACTRSDGACDPPARLALSTFSGLLAKVVECRACPVALLLSVSLLAALGLLAHTDRSRRPRAIPKVRDHTRTKISDRPGAGTLSPGHQPGVDGGSARRRAGQS